MSGTPTRRTVLRAGVAGAIGTLLAGCATSRTPTGPARHSSTPAPTPRPRSTHVPDPRAIKANELGVIPILMHHRLVAHIDSEYDMTPAYFRAELERLHREGYHPIRTIDLVRREFSAVPPGKTPVVLTFDDGSPGQFGYRADGAIDPRTAVGMMLDFHREHADFPAVASLYINDNPFGFADPRTPLTDLHRLGFEIGNHTYDHVDLGRVSGRTVEAEFGRLQTLVERAVRGVRPLTMALPLGVEPRNEHLARTGVYRGRRYRNLGVLLVGANPSHSPYHEEFDPARLPRIRSSSYHRGHGRFLATYWLDYLRRHDDVRYRAAGNPGHVTFPRSYAAVLGRRWRSRAVAY